jgi:hypothetical protein
LVICIVEVEIVLHDWVKCISANIIIEPKLLSVLIFLSWNDPNEANAYLVCVLPSTISPFQHLSIEMFFVCDFKLSPHISSLVVFITLKISFVGEFEVTLIIIGVSDFFLRRVFTVNRRYKNDGCK